MTLFKKKIKDKTHTVFKTKEFRDLSLFYYLLNIHNLIRKYDTKNHLIRGLWCELYHLYITISSFFNNSNATNCMISNSIKMITFLRETKP